MKFQLATDSKVNDFITIFKNIKNLVPLVNLIINEDSLYIQGMDSSHICLLEILLKDTWFDLFEQENMVLGINSEMLYNVVEKWKPGYSITAYTADNDYLIIRFDADNMLTKVYSIQLLDIDSETLQVPDKEYDLDLILKSNVFKDVISEISTFDSTIKFICTLKKINLKADGDMGKVDIEIKDSDIIEYAAALEDDGNIDIDYGVGNIKEACNFYKLNENVNVHISNNMPIKIHYQIADCTDSFVRLFIAPKIMDE